MSWSIQDVARMAKVTSRTLRHYDAVGLLKPARIGGNGYRYYEREQLLRLQQILLLRELGLGLEAIAEILGGRREEPDTLRRHQKWLSAESDRLAQLADTVSRTIAEREGGTEMAAEELFAGFTEKAAQLENDLAQRYGEGVRTHFADSRRHTEGWGKAEYESAQQHYAALDARVLALLREGAAPQDPRVQDVIDDHYAAVAQFWTPNRESYTGLGQLYVDSPDFRARYDAQDPAMAEYLRDAIAAYAQARLS